jgi:hypothetical protein
MIKINLHKSNELDVEILFPETWNELHENEVLDIAKQILNSNENTMQTKAALLLSFIDARAKQQKIKLPKQWKNLLDLENLVIDGLPLLDFVFGENNLTKPPQHCLQLQGTRTYEVYAPDKGFESITNGEFETAEVYFNQFVNNPSTNNLAHLAAILWKPKYTKFYTKNNDGTLEQYNYENWVKLFSKLETYRLYSIFIWYVGCRNQLPKIFPVVHEPSDESTETSNPTMAFTNCIHAGAGVKNGTRDNIRLMKLFEFMYDMEQEAIKAKELKKQYEQHS